MLKQQNLDPSNPKNHFQAEVLQLAQDVLTTRMEAAMSLGKGIVLDRNNLTPVRAYWSKRARTIGYHVEALIFSSKSAETNVANVRFRNGLQLSDKTFENRNHLFQFFNQTIHVGAKDLNSAEVPTDIHLLLRLSRNYSSLDQALNELSPKKRAALESRLHEDYFDSVRFVWTPDMTAMPHDTPVLRTVPRIYAALTNKCNRACPWCCVFSNPNKNTFLEPEQLLPHFPKEGSFDLQLEGGEPTIHPKLFEFVNLFRAQPNAGRLILITNGVKLPRTESALKDFILKFGTPFTIKLSINHYLLERDKLLIEKAQLLRKVVESLGPNYQVIFNVRLRRGKAYGDDAWVLDAVRTAGLDSFANVFFLQSYGLASGESEWEPPFTVNDGFKLINPDGSVHTGTLEDRANKMGALK